MNVFVNAALLGFIRRGVKKSLMALAPVRRVRAAVMKDLGLPEDILTFVNYPTRFDDRDTQRALKGSSIACPPLKDYAWRLWDYWERHLDPALKIDHSLKGTVAGKVVLVTGGSSGIGLAAACKFAEAGAITVICARDEDKLAEAKKQILAFAKSGGRADAQVHAYAVDISDDAPTQAFIGVLTNAPRFSAYVASKAALDAWTRCALSEFADVGVTFGTINMPLVRTPMIAPTKIYANVTTLSPEEAADMIAQACVEKPVRIATRLGVFGEVLHAFVPRVAQIVSDTTFRMFPDSSAASGDKGGKPKLSAEAVAMQQMMRGIHF